MENEGNLGGNHMSLTQRAARRAALFAGSSLTVASLAAALSFSTVALAPVVSRAQVVCTPPPTSGAGTGTVTYTGSTSTIQAGLACTVTGNATINIQTVDGFAQTVGTIDLNLAGGAQTTLTHTPRVGTWIHSTGGSLNRMVLRTVGAGDLNVVSTGTVGGYVDLSGHAGDLTWSVNTQWATTGHNRFGSGDNSITIGDDAIWTAYSVFGVGSPNTGALGSDAYGDPTVLEAPVVMEFAGGEDTFTNNGVMMLGPKSANEFTRSQANDYLESETRFENLDRFENSGAIYLGGRARADQKPPNAPGNILEYIETDGVADDLLMMPGTHFVGSGDSRIVLDAIITANQSACDASLRNTATTAVTEVANNVPTVKQYLSGEMPASDCVGLQGGSTEGATRILLNLPPSGDRGGPVRIVLVDVAGGVSEGGHFVLDPETRGYNPDQGGYIDLGYVIMPLVYDAEAQQHVLLGTAGQNAWQTAGWAAAAHDIWRTSTRSWFDRQADLRGNLPDGTGGGIWLRASTDLTDRKVTHAQTAGTAVFRFDNSYEQNTYAITGGADLLVGDGSGSAWVAGVMVGYANSEMTYDASPNTAQFDSWNGGLYASLVSGGLYIDAAVSANRADIKGEMPGLGLLPAGTMLDTRLLTVGAQIEGGWRFPLGGTAFVEPLAGVSWVRTEWDDLSVPSGDLQRPGIDVEFNDPTSLRANLGARLGVDQDYGGFRAQYSILGRVWEEFEGEHSLTLHNTLEDILVGDEFTGTMTEVGFNASIYGDVVSGFVNVGGKFAEDYESVGGSVGVRVAF